MKTIIKKYVSIHVLLILIYLLVQLFFLTNVPDIMEDEPWYANTAFNFTQGNWFENTNVGRGGGDYFVIYTFLLAIVIKLFGCSLFVTRMASVIAGLISLWGIISILKQLKTSKFTNILVLLMFIFSNVSYVVFRTTRPEGWILAFGIWSIYYLIKYHESKEVKNIIVASLLSSLSFLVHPNGVLFIINSGIYLLINAFRDKRISHLLYFSLSTLTIITVYFIFAFLMPTFSLKEFISQVSTRNSFSDTGFGIHDNISNFISIYALGIKRLYILIFEFGILVWGLFLSKKGSILRYIAIFGLLNLILSLSFFSHYSSRHFGEIIIFSLLSFALIIENIQHKKLELIVIVIGIVYLMNNLAGDGYIIYKKFRNTPYSEIESQISKLIPDNSTVLTSLHFWYPLKNTQFYSEYVDWDSKPYNNLEELLQSNSVDYVILTNALLEGKTGTSGREEKISASLKEFFDMTSNYIDKHGHVIESINTIGYDTLKVYKIVNSNTGAQ